MPMVVMLMAVGLAGAATPGDVVVMEDGVLARLVWLKLKGPPAAPSVTLRTVTVARVLVNVQVKSTPGFMFALGIVRVFPDSVPIVPVFPVVAALASIQPALVNTKPLAGASVIETGLLRFLIFLGLFGDGVDVSALVVVIALIEP